MPPYIAGTDVPQLITATCPRCKASRVMTSAADGQFGYSCGGCEYPLTIGAGAGPLTVTNAPAAGATALTVGSGGTAFRNGQYLWYAGASPEIVEVNGTPTGTNIPVFPLQFAHAASQGLSVATATLFLGVEGFPPNPGWGF